MQRVGEGRFSFFFTFQPSTQQILDIYIDSRVYMSEYNV